MTAPTTPAFTLVDHRGTPVTEASYHGRWALVFFGFTHCKAVCPRALGRLTEVMAELGPLGDAVEPLYITVDPERDTPPVMRAFLETNYPRFTGLTGTPEQVEAARKAFRVFARRVDDPADPDGYVVPHTAMTYLLDPTGTYATSWPDSADAATVTTELGDLLRKS